MEVTTEFLKRYKGGQLKLIFRQTSAIYQVGIGESSIKGHTIRVETVWSRCEEILPESRRKHWSKNCDMRMCFGIAASAELMKDDGDALVIAMAGPLDEIWVFLPEGHKSCIDRATISR